MASCGVLIKENDLYRIVLNNIWPGAARNSYSNKVLVILLYRKQLFY